MGSGAHIRCGHRRLYVTEHALERYGERVMPALEGDALIVQLRQVAMLGEWSPLAPAWALETLGTDGWLMLGDAIAFPAVGERLTTCLTPSEPSDAGRERRREARADSWDRAPAPGRRKKNGKVAREDRRRRARLREAVDG